MTNEQQSLLARVKIVLGARIKAGLLYTAMGSHAKEPQFSEGVIWALERVLTQVEALSLDILTDVPNDLNAGSRAKALWNNNQSPNEHSCDIVGR